MWPGWTLGLPGLLFDLLCVERHCRFAHSDNIVQHCQSLVGSYFLLIYVSNQKLSDPSRRLLKQVHILVKSVENLSHGNTLVHCELFHCHIPILLCTGGDISDEHQNPLLLLGFQVLLVNSRFPPLFLMTLYICVRLSALSQVRIWLFFKLIWSLFQWQRGFWQTCWSVGGVRLADQLAGQLSRQSADVLPGRPTGRPALSPISWRFES